MEVTDKKKKGKIQPNIKIEVVEVIDDLKKRSKTQRWKISSKTR